LHLKAQVCRSSKEALLKLDGHQLQIQQIGTDEQSVISVEEANVELLTKTDGTEYIRISLQGGNVLEVKRVNPTQTVNIID
jgi:hypothetical protein